MNVGIVTVSLKLIKVNFKIQILYKLTNKTKKEIGKKKKNEFPTKLIHVNIKQQ